MSAFDPKRNAGRFNLVAHDGPIRPMSLILFSLAGSGATTMTSPSRGWKPSINRIFWPWVTTTSVPGPRHASIVARAPAVSASRLAFNTKALLKVGASSTGPMFINSAVCRHRHHWELTILPTLTCCVRKRSPRARASARPCSLKLSKGSRARQAMVERLSGSARTDHRHRKHHETVRSPLLALSGHPLLHCTCPLSGLKRTHGSQAPPRFEIRHRLNAAAPQIKLLPRIV